MILRPRGGALAAVPVMALLSTAPPAAGSSDADALPGPPPGRFAIRPAADSIRLPFEMFRGEIRLIGRLDGKEVRLLIDNGALWDELLFFGSPKVDALNLKREGEARMGGAGSGAVVTADVAQGIDLSFEGLDGRMLDLFDQTGIITPYDADRPNPWEGSEGQVSAAFFKRFVVQLDFDAGILTLFLPEAFDATDRGVELPMSPKVDSGSWTVPAAITLHDGRRLELDTSMDLGWDDPVAINSGGPHAIEVPDGLAKTMLGIGAQGEIYGYHGTVVAVEIGGSRFHDVPATYSTVEDGGSKVDEVMIGLGIFSRFHVCFDYPGHRLLLKPNRKFSAESELPGS